MAERERDGMIPAAVGNGRWLLSSAPNLGWELQGQLEKAVRAVLLLSAFRARLRQVPPVIADRVLDPGTRRGPFCEKWVKRSGITGILARLLVHVMMQGKAGLIVTMKVFKLDSVTP